MTNRICTVLMLILSLGMSFEIGAQSTQASVSGIITDSSGAVVPGVTVAAIGKSTGERTVVTTNDGGFYVINALPIGEYVVEAEKTGFKKFARQGLTLTSAATIPLDIQLEIGEVGETVTITAETPLLQSRSSEVSQTIEARSVEDVPLGDRRTLNIIQTVPAAVFVGYNAGDKPQFSIAGGRAQSSNFIIDGGTGQNMRLGIGGVDLDPPVETVQEVKVLANSFTAEYGASAGGVVIVTTKSGTNDFRGSLFEYVRNDALDAANYFAPVVNGKKVKAPIRYNVFGGTLGGPVFFPAFGEGGKKIYNGRDRTFFFFAYEGARRTEGSTRSLTVPSVLQRQGNFSSTLGAPLFRQANNTIGTTVTANPIVHTDGSAVRVGQIYDPTTVRRLTGNVVSGTYFPGNIIPTNRLDPVGLNLAGFYPLPNTANTVNFAGNNAILLVRNNITAKIDHNFTQNDKIQFRYLYNSDNLDRTSVFPNQAADDNIRNLRHQNYFYGSYTRIFSPTVVNELRYTYATRITHEQSFGLGGDYPSRLGLTGVPNDAFPTVAVAGFAQLGSNTQERRQFPIKQHQIVDTASVTRGRHSVKFGGEYRYSFNTEINRASVSGAFGFAAATTGVSGLTQTGSSFASLLTGAPNTFGLRETQSLERSSKYMAAFVQDDWTISKRLTLNLGVRWEVDTPLKDLNNRLNSFDAAAINPVSGTPGVVRFAGINGTPTLPYDTDWNNFGPRVGFAYNIADKTVIRGGFGVFYSHPFDHAAPNSASLGFENSAAINSIDGGTTAPFFLRNGVPVTTLSGAPLNDAFGARVGGGGATVTFYKRNRPTGYSKQFNLGVQHQLPGTVLVELSFLGNLSRKLPNQSITLNQIDPSRITSATTSAVQANRPFPQFTNVSELYPTTGISNYYAGFVRAEKRFAQGLNFLTSYTYAKFLTNTDDGAGGRLGDGDFYSDAYNTRNDYGPSANDIRHRFTVSSVYELPFGKGKPFLSNNFAGKIFGGFTLGLLGTVQTGAPFTVGTQTNNTFAFSAGAQRADLIGVPNLPSGERTPERYFNTAAFAQPANGRFGTSGKGILRGPGLVNFDASLLRDFSFSETTRLQLRAEALNVFNHTNFLLPGNTFGATDFGIISSAREARRFQLGIRFLF